MSVKVEKYNLKYLRMKPEVAQIFEDLEDWKDHCRFKLVNFDPADLYKSDSYQKFLRRKKEWLKDQANKRNK